ncbi:hypothetical protein AHF37_04526 [Paragonimus kellicotti]|nr:hypothetical protein AHF37_04526 [Paragonimus kellicotti]
MDETIFSQRLDRLTRGLTTSFQYVRSNHVNRHLINRLGLETSLQGHQGCVNCLEWNERGTHLASGSDDCCLILWDPFEHKNVFVMNTGHVGNIFSVKFLPNVNEYLIVTGAADAKVRVHDVSRMETRHVFSCHSARIKRLANTPSEPFLFWSASEDGTVRQFDLRDPTQAGCDKPRNVLVNLQTHIGSLAEAKCLALNPLRPEMLAVGSNDPYVRVYDRRKLSLCVVNPNARLRERRSSRLQPDASTSVSESDNETIVTVPSDGVRYFVPGHLPCKELSYRRCFRHVNVTCVSFSPDGSNLLANMGGDHIYLFNLKRNILPYRCSLTNTAYKPPTGMIFGASSSDRPLLNRMSSISTLGRSGRCRPDENADCDKYTPSPALVQASIQAACLIKAKAFVAAVRAYNDMIQRWPTDPQLYTGRATALLRRGCPAEVVRHWIRPPSNTTEPESDSSSCPGVLNSSVSVDQMGQNGTELHANATENSNGLNLHKFFHSLDCEIQSKEAESTRTKESAEQKSPNERKAEHRPIDGERDPNKFLVLRQSNLISQENGSATFSDTSQTSSTSSSSAVHMDSSDVPEPDSAHTTTIRVSPARFCSDMQNAPDEQEIASPLCSCIGCVTNCCRYDHEFEREWRANASDYTKRFLGHCNAITDIKEANFFGGYVFISIGLTGDIYSALLDCQTTLNLTRSNQPQATVQSNDCMHVTALLLSARCLLRLDWIREARVMLDKVQQKYSHWIRPPSNTTEPESDSSSCPGVLNSSVSVDQMGQNGTELHANATENSNGLNLHKFFHSLDCEIQSKEAESTRTKESAEQKSPNERKAEHRPIDGERGG